jgi:hypothetical protein
MSMAAAAAKMKLQGKKLTPSVTKAIKASPAGMFPAAAAKAGISMGSKLGQAITKSGAGKLPSGLSMPNKDNVKVKNSTVYNAMKYSANAARQALGSAVRKR